MERLKQGSRLAILTGGALAAVIGLQLAGAMQFSEWRVLNQWFRLRPPETRTVPIVLITITEPDLQHLGRWPLSDAQLAAVLNRVKRDRPTAIGLDLYRDLPIEPGHAELLTVFETTPNLIGITKASGDTDSPAVLPPPILRDRHQIGVNDLLLDADGVVRRNLLSVQQHEQEILALGTRLASMYLSSQGIVAGKQSRDGCLHLGKAEFCRLQQNAGGYIGVDTGGYQTLSNFLKLRDGIASISLTDVMTNQVPPSLFQNKIVLIGTKAESSWGDRFYTPYTTDSTTTWAGVEIHANVAAQLISSALEGRPLLQGVPQRWGWGWILLWSATGTVLGWSLRSLQAAIVLIPVGIGSIFGIAYGLFLLGWWTIAVAPALAFVMAGSFSRGYWVWQTLKQANQLLEFKVQERTQALIEQNVALEQARQATETANRALERLSRMDELTQVANRRFFNEYLHQSWHQMMQAQEPLCLIMIDVDVFKLYNDTYGHAAGDDCLSRVANVLQTTVKRSTDLVARYGGEEFTIILPHTPLSEAIDLTRDIQANMNSLKIPHQRSQVSPFVTLSMGVVCMVPTPQTSLTLLFSKADQALYQAKMEGRDRVVVDDLKEPRLK